MHRETRRASVVFAHYEESSWGLKGVVDQHRQCPLLPTVVAELTCVFCMQAAQWHAQSQRYMPDTAIEIVAVSDLMNKSIGLGIQHMGIPNTSAGTWICVHALAAEQTDKGYEQMFCEAWE